jgi:hypothetical protein
MYEQDAIVSTGKLLPVTGIDFESYGSRKNFKIAFFEKTEII